MTTYWRPIKHFSGLLDTIKLTSRQVECAGQNLRLRNGMIEMRGLWPKMRATGAVQPFEKEYFRKDGSRVPVLVGGGTLGEGGDVVVVFALDLTERKRAEAELAHTNRVATMGQLTASIAHEVNQPLAAGIMKPRCGG
jgi:signal transduction histidine kinase